MIALISIAFISIAFAGHFEQLQPFPTPAPPAWTQESHPHLFEAACQPRRVRVGEVISEDAVTMGVGACNGQLISRRSAALAEWKIDVELVHYRATSESLEETVRRLTEAANLKIEGMEEEKKTLRRKHRGTVAKVVLVGAGVVALGYGAGRLGI